MDEKRFQRILRKCRSYRRWLASRHGALSPEDLADLEQEMALAILQARDGHTDAFYMRLAQWRASDWLRRHHHTRSGFEVRRDADIAELVEGGRFRRVWC